MNHVNHFIGAAANTLIYRQTEILPFIYNDAFHCIISSVTVNCMQ